ncbi:MAG: Rrf2 family transcriptional regulator [Planctomycetaceae bacterium]|jgi:Rrf2 family protein|nr:Rrf2 family transcriptional regulator [Planctomycetaceae bacterium]
MKLSTKGKYALRMMLDLAEHRSKGIISLKDIADRQGISKKYLEQIVPLLHRPKMILTHRGPQGGYSLAKQPERYTVGDILRTAEGGISPFTDVDSAHKAGESKAAAMTVEVWRGLEKVITDYLDHLTLQDVLDRFGDAGKYEFNI